VVQKKGRGVATIAAAEITDRESFKAWLEARPKAVRREVAVAMASRCALRVVPLLSRGGKLTMSQHVTLLKVSLWRNIISRSVRTWPDREIAAAASADASDASDAFYASASAAAADAFYASAAAAADAAASAASDAFYASAASAAADADIWENIRSDAQDIEQGVTGFSLYAKPVWRQVPAWWKNESHAFVLKLKELEISNGQLWLQWYDAVAQGLPAFGLKTRKTAEALERAIALGGKDGTFHAEFWDRDFGAITAEIAEWVREARVSEQLALGQGSGLRFQIRNSLVVLGKYLGLRSPADDQLRIQANLPQLAELADILKAALGSREAPYPPLLLKMLARFTTLVKSPAADIEPEHLFSAATLLREQIESATKPSTDSNAPPLEGGELALAKSITLISDLVVLGTTRGKALFDDADRAAKDAGPDETFMALSKELFELVKTSGGIMDETAIDLLLDIMIGGQLSPHPLRFAFLQNGSAKNAITVIGFLALASLASGNPAFAYLLDKLVDVGIMVGGAYVLSPEAKVIIDDFITKNETKLRAIARQKESLKWLEDVLDLIEEQRKKNDK
jgi:hypothetical protein